MADENSVLQSVIDRYLPPDKPLRILEAGCGSISHIRIPEQAVLVGIDILERQLAANQRLQERVLGDLQAHQWKENDFDMIVCWDVLEHLPDPRAAVHRMLPALKPGGILVLAFPNLVSVKGVVTKLTPFWFHEWFYRVVIGDRRRPEEFGQFPTYLRTFMVPGRIRRLGEQAGLEAVHYRLYEGPVQSHMRSRNALANFAFSLVGMLSSVLSLRRINLLDSDCIVVFAK